jgi:hypothetical protein
MNDLLALEQQLRRACSSVNLIAEIDLSPQLLEELRLGIKSLLRAHSFQTATSLLQGRYPAAFVCYLVAEGIYSYKDGDYWGNITENLRPKVSEQLLSHEWGKTFEDILSAWNKPLFEDIQGYRYVSRILLHGGIPNFSLRDFFKHVLVPLIHGEDSLTFDLEESIHDWLHFSSHRYQVDKPISYFLQEGGQYARDFVSRCITMMQHYQSQRYLASPQELGLPERIVQAFQVWVQEQAPETKRASQRFVRPQIWLDLYGQGVVVDLPSQTLPKHDEQYVLWKIDDIAQYEAECYSDHVSLVSEAQRHVLPYKECYRISFNYAQAKPYKWEFYNDPGRQLLVFDGDSCNHIASAPTKALVALSKRDQT